ncbi:DUF805 domain-containing protein [Streptomyces sp. ISL-10]|uniref:DUF805 domain-containing protein n=1 Tax=Streptomyces sp. ISL-10 TaxID=2819172 RepID=UPI001BEB8587|nr:DUF805 domain-containing protein [Streptomyces sp. ISL-10]MBT2366038.1 DUF805 domain-containing protein [Streptomyces sp. ISL-10]
MSWYLAVLKNYAGFSGRARRKEYWMFTLINIIIALVLMGIDMAAGTYPIIYAIYTLALLLPTLAVTVRRLHDTGRSGWWIFISAIPLVGGIILLVFLASEGKAEANKFGADPKLAPVAA